VHAARDATDVRDADTPRRPWRAEALRGEREATSLACGELGPGRDYASNVQRP